MMKILNYDHDGFSLVEMMVVVGVIAILAAIAIPSYLGIQRKAARSEARANLEAIALAMEAYMAENNNYGANPANTGFLYVGNTFINHPGNGNIERIARLGDADQLLYEYRITFPSTSALAFTLFATPVPGRRQEGDLNDVPLRLDSAGNKGPEGAGW
jgi:type IV pilus assembly protein PilE